MTEFFGFEVPEEYQGQFYDLVCNIDPYYHKAIACGLSYLAEDYGDKAYRQIDSWFTAVYATVMEMEEVMNNRIDYYRPKTKLDQEFFKSIEAKD